MEKSRRVKGQQVWIAVEAPSIQVVIERVLRGAGLSVQRLAGSGDLLARLTMESPHLLVLDPKMLETVADRLSNPASRRDRLPPVMVIAERWDGEAVSRLRRLGATGVLRWPVQAPELLGAMSRLLVPAQAGPPPPPDIPDVVICGFGAHGHIVAYELVQAGYQVRVMPDGHAASRLIVTGHFRSVLLDLDLPALEVALEALDKLPDHRPLLAVGRLDWREMDRLRRRGALTFLGKPLQMSELLVVVREILAESAAAPGGGRTR